jgi:hypothetical protein
MQKLHPSPSTGFAEEAGAIFEKARSRENLEICDQVSDAAMAECLKSCDYATHGYP